MRGKRPDKNLIVVEACSTVVEEPLTAGRKRRANRIEQIATLSKLSERADRSGEECANTIVKGSGLQFSGAFSSRTPLSRCNLHLRRDDNISLDKRSAASFLSSSLSFLFISRFPSSSRPVVTVSR